MTSGRAVPLARLALSLVGAFFALQAVALGVTLGAGAPLMGVGAAIVPTLVAVAAFWGARRLGALPGASPPWLRSLRMIVGTALVLGVVGFVLGFFGPMLLAPQANQGPMLGIFITGPVGFLAGLVIGIVRMRAATLPASVDSTSSPSAESPAP